MESRIGSAARGNESVFSRRCLDQLYNTNEHFTVDEFIRANCEYPGKWGGEIERIEQVGNLIITVVHVYSLDQKVSCHAVSFIEVESDKIASMDEYWGDDGSAPLWRLNKHIGAPIF